MRKLLSVVAAAALAGSAGLVSIAALGGAASATKPKAPVTATCSALSGDTTIDAALASDPLLSTINGCTSADTKVTSDALDVSALNSGSESDGTGTIYFTNGKDVTYTFTTTSTSGLSCGTFEGQAANEEEIITLSVTGGTAKLTAGSPPQTQGFDVCVYVSSASDGSIHEASTGTVTL